jgi:hypothetical protein
MEWVFKTVTLTLMTVADGTTSLYVSNGGGVLGGNRDEAVQRASANLLAQVNSHFEYFKTCETFPGPEPNQTVFYIITDSGVLCGDGFTGDLGYRRHPLSPVFHAGHALLTQLRLASEAADA